ncbi:thioredoxin [Paenibacillus sp. LMG 31456]|uniref:Thioredoxin n=1 Tax=Paenibacillus foliorum TaxID=2654974 RepID=A0A972K0T1_9BACL|nr:thioredoxin [Paenibacillus foliorum]NOU93188.1 thioredoxin [Paenibacillus foliorum]
MALIQVSDHDFEEKVMKAKVPVLVDFYADWCELFQVIEPMLQELSEDFSNHAVIAKVNIDENPMVANQHHIISIPTMKLFKDGKLTAMMIGRQPKSELTKMIRDLL